MAQRVIANFRRGFPLLLFCGNIARSKMKGGIFTSKEQAFALPRMRFACAMYKFAGFMAQISINQAHTQNASARLP